MNIINNLKNFIGGMPLNTDTVIRFNNETLRTAVGLWFSNRE